MKSGSQEWMEKQRERLAPEDICKERFRELPIHEQDKIVEQKKAIVKNMEVEER